MSKSRERSAFEQAHDKVLSEMEFRRRHQEFPPRILQLSYHNPAINRIVEEYCQGNISFINEALAQMVIILATDWTAKQEESIRVYALATNLPDTPKRQS